MKNISYYGKSMYGGWYANYFDEATGHYNGQHANTFKELCDKLGMTSRQVKESGCRFDN